MKRDYTVVGLVFLIFFVMSLITNILNPIMPAIIASFKLSLKLGGFLPTSFFIAYLISIPAGMLIERKGEKPVLIGSFVLALVGSLCFAAFPRYAVALSSLFLIGVGIAIMQVAINPLLRVAGGEEHFAFLGVMAQLVFGSASYLSPHIFSTLVDHLKNGANSENWLVGCLVRIVPADMTWVALYWLFAVICLGMIAILFLIRLPRVELKDEERMGGLSTHLELLHNKFVILYFIGIFAYVGTEQGVANWISKFLQDYHGFNPDTQGAYAVAGFWGLMLIGCILGLVLLKLMDSRRVLIVFVIAAMSSMSLALFGPARVSLWAFQLVGFFLSVMWSVVFSLALNSVDKHHGSFSGILCTGIVGGAAMPPIIGYLGDHFGLRMGLTSIYLTLAYILSIGIWAKPLIHNATIVRKKQR
jgi:FHS family L-fucose permease-like MFS transporter